MVNIVRNYFRLGPWTGNRDGAGVQVCAPLPVKGPRSAGSTHGYPEITG